VLTVSAMSPDFSRPDRRRAAIARNSAAYPSEWNFGAASPAHRHIAYPTLRLTRNPTTGRAPSLASSQNGGRSCIALDHAVLTAPRITDAIRAVLACACILVAEIGERAKSPHAHEALGVAAGESGA